MRIKQSLPHRNTAFDSEFQLVYTFNGKTVIIRPVNTLTTNLGSFNVFNFSEAVVSVGNYTISLYPEKHINRLFNARTDAPEIKIDLSNGARKTNQWDVTIKDPDSPWDAVIIPDGDLTWKKELKGTFEKK